MAARRRIQKKSDDRRRRTGCWTCKEKHVLCTEERPECSRCKRLNLKCAYGLRLLWREDAAQRGICLGREGRWTKEPQKAVTTSEFVPFKPANVDVYVGRWIFLNVTYDDFGDEIVYHRSFGDAEVSEDEGEVVAPLLQLTVNDKAADGALALTWPPAAFRAVPPLISTPLSGYSSIEGSLFEYFVTSICPSCSLSSSQNPYLKILTPMSFMFAPLKSALLAVSANQLTLLNDKRFQKEALEHKSIALQGVQRAIDVGEVGCGVVATILLLCFYDISDGCNDSWVSHLRGGLSLLEIMSNSRALAGDSILRRFLHMYFVAHEIMSRTATKDDLIDQTLEWLEDDNLEEICTMMGCSRSLMTLIRQTTTLASKVSQLHRTRELTEFEVEKFSASRDSIEHLLNVLQQQVPPNVVNPDELLKISETKRLSAILYLRDRLQIVSSLQKFTPTTHKSDLVSAIVSLISSLPNLSTLLWPLFVLGNTELNEENRHFVLERLTNIQRVRNLGSVRQARILVEHAWKKSDLSTDAWQSWDGLGPRRQTRNMISLA